MNSLSFDCLLSLSLGYHTRRKTGELLRILGRADAVNNFFETLIFTFFPVLIDRASPNVRCRRAALRPTDPVHSLTVPVAAVVLGVRYGALIVAIVMVVSVILCVVYVCAMGSRRLRAQLTLDDLTRQRLDLGGAGGVEDEAVPQAEGRIAVHAPDQDGELSSAAPVCINRRQLTRHCFVGHPLQL